jgi:hypothetical protein
MPTITAKGSLKVTAVIPPEALLGLEAPNGQPRLVLTIVAGDSRYRVDLAAKSVRRAITAVREHGAENVAAIIQGKLVGDAIAEAGLVVQPRVPKAHPEAVAA